MGSSFSVYSGTFGNDSWAELAQERAFKSIPDHIPWVHAHEATLHEARNKALASVETEWCVCLDADDELEPGYVEAMAEGTADVRAPRVRCMRNGKPVVGGLIMPRVWKHHHDCTAECLPQGSWVCVGAAVRAEMVRAVGGWQDWPIYEDWALWLACYKAGATFEPIPDAIYRQHLRRDSRNHVGDAWLKRDEWHHKIVAATLG